MVEYVVSDGKHYAVKRRAALISKTHIPDRNRQHNSRTLCGRLQRESSMLLDERMFPAASCKTCAKLYFGD